MYIDPDIVMWGLFALASASAFMAGLNYGTKKRDDVIEDTIVWLVENNFVKSKKVDDEIELIPLDKD